MKVALIIPSVHWNCPYVDIYARLFDSHGVKYDIISFNRKLDKEDTKYHFDYGLSNNSDSHKKLIAVLKYCSFIKRILKKEKYDRLVVFSSQLGIGLLQILLKEYKGRFIIDYRDLSIEQRLKYPFKKVLGSSYMNVISSPGFKRVLPQGYEYILCHNFDVSLAEKAIHEDKAGKWHEGKKKILTIGGIRDYDANVKVINAIKDSSDYSLSFVGRGESSDLLSNYCKEMGVKNVSFVGFYKKEEEAGYIDNSDFINIFYPRRLTHDTAVSNRFYNSLIHKKPMITTADTTQGDFAAKYGLGIALDDCNNLVDRLESFQKENDYGQYSKRCNELLLRFIGEQHLFEQKVLEFVDTPKTFHC